MDDCRFCSRTISGKKTLKRVEYGIRKILRKPSGARAPAHGEENRGLWGSWHGRRGGEMRRVKRMKSRYPSTAADAICHRWALLKTT
ncbi:hypothetical protein F2P81_019253 [Scophthalmus maximus]|uniref:Uncharacterized protein n=1 Tax=Scophthalmus maximus TaxID=52904 RepID=A0A6A4RZ50_SCOMX|nr:hypothetical protein F2P81_019253 [Scophthalmus maximus]